MLAISRQVIPEVLLLESIVGYSTVQNCFCSKFIEFLVNLVGYAVGNIYSWSSPEVHKLNGSRGAKENPLASSITSFEETCVVSVALLGAILGTLIPIYTSKMYGRKKSLIILTIPSTVGFVIFCTYPNLIAFIIARFLCGVTLGAGFQIVPVYIAEISSVPSRGAMGCYFSIALSLGQFFDYLLGPFISFLAFNLICLCVTLSAMIIIGFCVEETPFYHLERNNVSEAERVLRKLRFGCTDDGIKAEMADIMKCIKTMENQVTLKNVLSDKALRKSLMISLSLAIYQKVCIIGPILSYLEMIFDAVGSSISPELSAIYVGFTQILACIVIPLFMDRCGRKILLVISQFVLCASLMALGTFFYLKFHGYDVSEIFWLPLASLVIYIISFNTGIGSVCFVVVGEIFPENAKNLSASLTMFTMFITGFTILLIFPILVEAIKYAYTFWIFGILCGLSSILFYIILPETKGKTFLEIQDILSK